MSELSKQVVQELLHLNSYRKAAGPMQSAHEALFRAKVIEFAEPLIQAAAAHHELTAKLAKTEQYLKEAIEALEDFKDAVSAP
jgi:hypothetical protein